MICIFYQNNKILEELRYKGELLCMFMVFVCLLINYIDLSIFMSLDCMYFMLFSDIVYLFYGIQNSVICMVVNNYFYFYNWLSVGISLLIYNC